MCTVSFVRVNDSVIITSNRDENIERENAAAPDFHLLQNKKVIFPKDAKAGGTWFAAADNGNVSVLLNGAFQKHTANPPYRKSRGLILLQIIENDEPFTFFKSLNLDNIEPFTIVLYQADNFLYELRWDGNAKHEKQLNVNGHYIWSSSTLYSNEVIERREKLFNEFISIQQNITAESIHGFHAHNHGDDENGFVISRQNGMKTFSITQAVIKDNTIQFLHTDLLKHQQFEETMTVNRPIIKL